ncbi:MAG: alpha-glucan family phosphorylase [Holophagaceae bacterium]
MQREAEREGLPVQSALRKRRSIAYFSMEIALAPSIPTYSGGLGMLAGDTIRAAADRRVPMIAVSLVHRQGYSIQRVDAEGWQHDEQAEWHPENVLQEVDARISVLIEGRTVVVRAWRYDVEGITRGIVPVLLLDTNVPENSDWDRTLTNHLYGGDAHYRLCQEVVLGIGGVKMLRSIGYDNITRFHMNEGHAALLVLALLDEQAERTGKASFDPTDVELVRRLCVFTTHTPVPAGHDRFPLDLAQRVLGRPEVTEHRDLFCFEDTLNMTYLALNASHYINGVAKKHAEVSKLMFAEYEIDAITNGIHVPTWVCPFFQSLFEQHIPGWKEDAFSLRSALGIPPEEIWEAHMDAKQSLLDRVNQDTGIGMDPGLLTLGFARRVATYKRAGLLFQNADRLRKIAREVGPFQVVFAGKAHPQDAGGKDIIHRIHEEIHGLEPDIKIVYLNNYDWDLGRLITSGVDVWLNTPQPPMEASGTSGMKAAVNGVPSLSVLDGWWIEGCIEGSTGWGIGDRCDRGTPHVDQSECDANSLYDKLERVVIPMYYQDRGRFIEIMQHAIALNGSFFNTQRMILQYVQRAYFE